ncbi:MAG: shikimate dehydrogenase [Terrimesophilobacter sp.]
MSRSTLAVLGHPIGHSRSPVLHASAYDALGLPWDYEAVDVTEAQLPSFVAGLGPAWRGLSLTMPLKRAVVPLLDECDDLVAMIGVANTVLLSPGVGGLTRRGFNTDVGGVMDALGEANADLRDVQVLGSGATATSVLVALSRLGVTSVTVSARSSHRAGHLRLLAQRIGVELDIVPLDTQRVAEPTLLISTVPGGAQLAFSVPTVLTVSAVLLDVAYAPWPTSLAAQWSEAGGTVLSGLEMLMWQALRQVRVFVSGDQDTTLTNEHAVIAAMRASVGLTVAHE